MIAPGAVEALSMTFDGKMHRLENEIMLDVIRRLKINGEITRAADWQIYRLKELGTSQTAIDRLIAEAFDLDNIEEIYKKIIESDYVWDKSIYDKTGIEQIPFADNLPLQEYIKAVALQTQNTMQNLSNSLGFVTRSPNGKTVFTGLTRFYQDTLDNAINGIATGVFDYNQALRKAVNELTNSGLRSVDFVSGRSNRVDVAARRAIMTGFNQIVGKANEMTAQELGTDTYEVSWHSGARPSHQVWQGRWYTKDQLVSVCGLGSVTGLLGANCYHSYSPVVPGISKPTYTEKKLKQMQKAESEKVSFGDKSYTKYEALQRQRQMETIMRAERQKIVLLKEGGADKADIMAARAKYRVTNNEYTRFSAIMNLPQQKERVTVDGLGRV